MNVDVLQAPSGIAYPITRRGEGPPLLLLHGFTGNGRTWEALAHLLPDAYEVLTIDLPGHGDSRLPAEGAWTFQEVVDDLAWLIARTGRGSANVLGYSMGGRLALALAVTHPQRVQRLILESASPGIADEQERMARRVADEERAADIERTGTAAFVAEWERLPMWASQRSLPQAVRERQRAIRLSQQAAGLAASLRATGAGSQPSYWECLATLCVPTLLIAGELDAKFARIAAAMHTRLPDSHLLVVPEAGHAVHLEYPQLYCEEVARFLAQPLPTVKESGGHNHD